MGFMLVRLGNDNDEVRLPLQAVSRSITRVLDSMPYNNALLVVGSERADGCGAHIRYRTEYSICGFRANPWRDFCTTWCFLRQSEYLMSASAPIYQGLRPSSRELHLKHENSSCHQNPSSLAYGTK